MPVSSEHTTEGVEHIQRAARELIGAARSFLDAAEDVVEDRELLGEAADVLRGLVRDFGSGAREQDRTHAEPNDGAQEHDEGGGDVGEGAPAAGVRSDEPESDEDTGRTPGLGGASRSTRVRRIDVE